MGNSTSFLLSAGPGEGGQVDSGQLIMWGAVIVVFYFFMIRPQTKKAKETKKFRSEMKQGDKIVTIGGIHGKILEVAETTVLISAEGGTKLRVEKSAISMDSSGIMNEAEAKK